MQCKRQIACTHIYNQPVANFVQISLFLISEVGKSKYFGSPPLCPSTCGSEEKLLSHQFEHPVADHWNMLINTKCFTPKLRLSITNEAWKTYFEVPVSLQTSCTNMS
jgi:hypothetical protein